MTVADELPPLSGPAVISPLAASLQKHTETLADDAFEGREAGQPGGYAAAKYIIRTLNHLSKVQPAGSDGYFQPFGEGYRNILAVLPGTNPDLSEEFLLLSAHYDHVGRGTKQNSKGGIGSIHNGADDNASGVAAILEVARMLSQEQRRGRSILLVFWDAEEKGLLGSKYWLQNPTLDLASLRYMVNLDMVGRLRDDVQLYGTRTMPGLRLAWSMANAQRVKLRFPWEMVNNSDHYEFFQSRIPVTMVHTGLHADYHRSSDDVHRLNQEGIGQVAELVCELVLSTSNFPKLAGFREASLREGKRDRRYYERNRQDRQRRLGITVVPATNGEMPALRVQTVWAGSPASQAGLVPGMLIHTANGVPVATAAELRRRIQQPLAALELTVTHAGRDSKIEVVFTEPPKRVGLSWRSTDAEPGVVMVSHVAPGSPADQAGCQAHDRILAVNGQRFQDSDDFRRRVRAAEQQVELTWERQGMIATGTLVLDPRPSSDVAKAEGETEENPPTSIP